MIQSSHSTSTARARWILVAGTALALLLLARLFVFGIYDVESMSMAPTLGASEAGGCGESVLVRYGRGTLERFDLVVLRRPGVQVPRVKRVVGLPGESVQIVRGDLVIDGERLRLDAPRPPLVTVFDDEVDAVSEWFQMGGTEVNPWTETKEGWHLAAEAVPSGAAAGTMFFGRRITVGIRSEDAGDAAGGVSAADCAIACEVRAGVPVPELHFILREQGDTFRAELLAAGGGRWSVRLLQRWRGGEELVLAEGEVALGEGSWTAVRFGNIDDHLFFEATPPGGVAQSVVAGPTTNHMDPSDRFSVGETYGHRVGLGGAVGSADFRRIRVSRDFHYTDRGPHASGEPVRLGPGEVFLLGDNSSASRDGRDWGPTSTSDIMGRPSWVVWPLGSVRGLGGEQRPLVGSDSR